MTWQDIINTSELIYISTPEDIGFQTWSLKKTNCNVLFYESYPIEIIDRIIIKSIINAGGTITEEKLATSLGFNIVDNFDVTPKRYADGAELDIFRSILKPVIDWGLIVKEKGTNEGANNYRLTELGKRSFVLEEKYIFFTGNKILFENLNIKPSDFQTNIHFPFHAALGIFSEITEIEKIEYDKINPVEIFDIEDTDLIQRHILQSNKFYQIYKSQLSKYFTIESCQVNIKLFKQGNDYYPIIFYNDQICIEATELLHLPDNINEKEKKIEWGLYLKLIKDPNAILDYDTIFPFEDLLDLDSLITDSRLFWNDSRLFVYIAEVANANQWHVISNNCPIDILKQYLESYKEKLDWTSLSMRINSDFVEQNAIIFPWNFETISSREDISIEVIKRLLKNKELKDRDWDWERIMQQLDFDFIKTNFRNIDFQLSELTKTNINDVLPLVAQYPDKNWDWTYISTEYNLNFILDNLLNFSIFLDLKKVIYRAFNSTEFTPLFCKSQIFKSLLFDLKETILRDYSPNREKYIWNSELIDLLEESNYLTWESGSYVIGFECNPHVNWSYDYFQKYNFKIATEKGLTYVSGIVDDVNIVLDFIDFHWDWNAISTNVNLISNKDFVLSTAGKLNLSLLLIKVDSDTISELFDKTDLLKFLSNNPDSWIPVTEKISIEFVRNHLNYDWDWSILTRRFYSSIKVESLGNSKWIDKWDWKYLTRNLDMSNLFNNLDLYLNYWDWEYLTEKLDKEFLINNLIEYTSFWDWKTIISIRFDKSDLLLDSYLTEVATCLTVLEEELRKELWQNITQKFDYSELHNLIMQTHDNPIFCWDFSFFYSLSNFNIRIYLQNFSEFVHWKELSECKKLEETFRFDNNLFSEQVWRKDIIQQLDYFQWDFHSLSKVDSICNDFAILKRYQDEWDWDYLTLNCSYFSGLNRDKRKLKAFDQYINYTLLSHRNDAGLTEKIISEYINKQWDWDYLSTNYSIQFSIEFILENEKKQWNWEAISRRNDIKFDNDTFLALVDKNWDWEAISRREDIAFSEEFISKVLFKPVNWFIASEKNTFVPNAKTLSSLKGHLLNWEAISQNANLAIDILWDYKDSFNWEHLTKNKIIDFSNLETLTNYRDYLDWNYISQSERFNISFKNLKKFKRYLNWKSINSRIDLNISEELVDSFADVLDWSNVSQSMKMHFTEDLIEKYRSKWDWQLLRKNPQVMERLDTALKKYKAEFNGVEFLEQFDRTPYIYHFTHLFNAIDIIKERKILSRNKAEGKFTSAAGNLVARRSTAHDYARFYFRPQTPTQFYNECLGWDASLMTNYGKSYYTQARNLGLPKCPIPVFFKFDLKEVLMKMADKCFYSTGNMQTNWARVEKVSDNPKDINTNYLYSSVRDYENYKQYSQQEFLIESDFDFSELNSFEIICYNEEYASLLKTQLGNDSIRQKINSNDQNVFHRGNRKILVNETDNEITISSEYRDSAYLSIRGEGLKTIQILNPDSIRKETTIEIIAYPLIKFIKSEHPIEVHFVDTTVGTRDWLIYKN